MNAMEMGEKISFIGGGNMAKALIGGLNNNGFDMSHILVVEPDESKRKSLETEFGVRVTDQLPSVVKSDIVIIAVKPQQLRDLSIFLGSLLDKQLVISIAAGIRSKDISRWLGGYDSIIRVMPNTPAQIQLGVSALYALPQVNRHQREIAELIMKAVGKTLWLDDETKMDAVTAISGSGPAYVFYLIESLEKAALELGLNNDQAKLLSIETFVGACLLAHQTGEDPSHLRAQVTSKGGTTEQAIISLEAAHVKQAIIDAAKAAARKSHDLGDQLGKD
jgi:pyrroline-5-carboxylate reductase